MSLELSALSCTQENKTLSELCESQKSRINVYENLVSAISRTRPTSRHALLDVMVIVDAPGTSGGAKSPDQAAKKKKSPKRSPPGTMQPRESSVDTCARCARPQHQPDCAARAACS